LACKAPGDSLDLSSFERTALWPDWSVIDAQIVQFGLERVEAPGGAVFRSAGDMEMTLPEPVCTSKPGCHLRRSIVDKFVVDALQPGTQRRDRTVPDLRVDLGPRDILQL